MLPQADLMLTVQLGCSLSAKPAALGTFFPCCPLCAHLECRFFHSWRWGPSLGRTLPLQPTVMACPQQVAHECLRQREKRMGIDLVPDDVEKELFAVSLATHIRR